MYPGKQHVLQDDIESFVWVILFLVLCHTKHSIPLNKLQGIVEDVFDSYRLENGVHSGGRPKEHLCSSPFSFLGHGFQVIGNAPLTGLIHGLLSAVAEWHQYARSQLLFKIHNAEPSNAGHHQSFSVDPKALQLHKHTNTPDPQPIPNPQPQTLQLYDHVGVFQLFIHALTNNGWPDCDQAVDDLKDIQDEHPRCPQGRGASQGPKKKQRMI